MKNTGMSLRAAFHAQVEAWIVQALQAGASNFSELLTRLRGVYPAVALDALNRMTQSGRASTFGLAFGLHPSTQELAKSAIIDALPRPHPLDFEWRFAKSTASELLSFTRCTKPEDVCSYSAHERSPRWQQRRRSNARRFLLGRITRYKRFGGAQ